jgi:hypothetical protein
MGSVNPHMEKEYDTMMKCGPGRTILLFLILSSFAGNPYMSGTVLAGEIPVIILKKYPENLYIIRSGGGETSESAAEAARFEISKFFETNIRGETIVNQWMKAHTGKGKTEETRSTEITNTIRISSSRDLPGIEIVSSRETKSRKQFEVWAVLEKKSYAAFLQEKIRKIDEEVDRKLADKGEGDMRRARLLSQSAQGLMSREKALDDLNLLKQEQDVPGRSSLFTAVMNSLDSLIAGSFDTGLVFGSGMDEKVRPAMIKGIVDAGIRVKEYSDIQSATGAGVDLILSVEHKVDFPVTNATVSGKDFAFTWANWIVSMKAIDPATQEIIETLVLNDKVSGASEGQTRDRMINAMLKIQVPRITTWVYGVIFKPEK